MLGLEPHATLSTKAEQEASNTTGAGNRGMQRESWVQVTADTEDIMDTGNRGDTGAFLGPHVTWSKKAKQGDKWTDRQMNGQMNRQANGQIDRWMDRWTDR